MKKLNWKIERIKLERKVAGKIGDIEKKRWKLEKKRKKKLDEN